MGRTLLQILVPLLLPLGLYFVWVKVTRALAQARGLPASGPAPSLLSGPWQWLLGAGLVLVIIGFIGWLFVQETLPAGEYVPTRWVDGQIVPGHTAAPE
ncbi:MAG: DUF6111 family protein [Alphaproteobacteria bacterium]